MCSTVHCTFIQPHVYVRIQYVLRLYKRCWEGCNFEVRRRAQSVLQILRNVRIFLKVWFSCTYSFSQFLHFYIQFLHPKKSSQTRIRPAKSVTYCDVLLKEGVVSSLSRSVAQRQYEVLWVHTYAWNRVPESSPFVIAPKKCPSVRHHEITRG